MKVPEWIEKYWIEWVFGVPIAGLGLIVKRLSSRLKKEKLANQALKDGMRSLLRRQIMADCEQAIKDGYCSTTAKGTIVEMYAAYNALGGDDVVTRTKDQAIDLPIVPPY